MRNQTHVDDAVRRTVEAVWRMESGQLIAALTRLTHDVGLAEDLAQEALLAALEQWPDAGVPAKPGAWLMTTARRRGIDVFRRNQILTRKTAELGHAEGAGLSAQPGPGQQLTQLATGSLILLLGGFVPWAAIKMFHFTGDALHSAHATAVQAPSGARTVLAAPQKLNAMHSQASHAAAKFKGVGGGMPDGDQPAKESAELLKEKPGQGGNPGGRVSPALGDKGQPAAVTAKPLAAGTGSAAAAGGSGGAAVAGGSVAAAAVVPPAFVAAATVTAAKKAGTSAANAASQSAPKPPTSPVQEWPHRGRTS